MTLRLLMGFLAAAPDYGHAPCAKPSAICAPLSRWDSHWERDRGDQSLSRKANAIRPRVRARGPGVGDEFRRVAIEIEHEAVERDLPPEFGAIE